MDGTQFWNRLCLSQCPVCSAEGEEDRDQRAEFDNGRSIEFDCEECGARWGFRLIAESAWMQRADGTNAQFDGPAE